MAYWLSFSFLFENLLKDSNFLFKKKRNIELPLENQHFIDTRPFYERDLIRCLQRKVAKIIREARSTEGWEEIPPLTPFGRSPCFFIRFLLGSACYPYSIMTIKRVIRIREPLEKANKWSRNKQRPSRLSLKSGRLGGLFPTEKENKTVNTWNA